MVRIEKEPFTIGRRPGNDLDIGANVLRDHARIDRTSGEYVIRDLESRFGTFVSGEPVTGAALFRVLP